MSGHCHANPKGSSAQHLTMANEQLQKKYLQFQMLQQQIEQISQQVELLNQQHEDLDISAEAIEQLAKASVKTEFLAPIANGIFVKGELADNQKLVINVGSDVTVEKNFQEVIDLLLQQKTEITQRLMEAEGVLQELTAQAMQIYKEVEVAQED